MSFYLNQANINQAALIVSIIGQKAYTLSQLNTKLTSLSAPIVTESYLIKAAQLGWLLTQPNGLWQVNLNMTVVNQQNLLISSLVPKIVSSLWYNAQPSSYVGGLGIVFSKAVDQNVKTGQISYYGNIVKPGTPVINDALILAPNPLVT